MHGHIAQRFAIGRVAPLADAAAPLDPPGLERQPGFDLGIGDAARRRVVTKAREHRGGGHQDTFSAEAPASITS